MKSKKILLIGGGTGGHILPLKNLADELLALGAKVDLVVSDQALDRKIVEANFDNKKTPVHYFRTGKIRRYFSFQNFVDFFRIIGSIFTARKMLKEKKPDVLFFKGGFVGFPFLMAAKYLLRFEGKIYSHESDTVSGVMTRLASKYADAVFYSFGDEPRPLFYVPERLLTPEISRGLTIRKILILGGSQGAEFLNKLFDQNKKSLCGKYHVTLVCGLGKEIDFQHSNFQQFPFLSADEYATQIQGADFIISRAGSSSLFEIVCARRPSVIVPLPSAAQNHQVKNAEFFQKQNLCHVLTQDEKAAGKFVKIIEEAMTDEKMKAALQNCTIKNAAQEIAGTIWDE